MAFDRSEAHAASHDIEPSSKLSGILANLESDRTKPARNCQRQPVCWSSLYVGSYRCGLEFEQGVAFLGRRWSSSYGRASITRRSLRCSISPSSAVATPRLFVGECEPQACRSYITKPLVKHVVSMPCRPKNYIGLYSSLSPVQVPPCAKKSRLRRVAARVDYLGDAQLNKANGRITTPEGTAGSPFVLYT